MGGGGTRAALCAGCMIFAVGVLVYLATAFVIWDFNAGHWTSDTRLAAVIFWAALAFIGAAGVGSAAT